MRILFFKFTYLSCKLHEQKRKQYLERDFKEGNIPLNVSDLYSVYKLRFGNLSEKYNKRIKVFVPCQG